MVQKLKDIITKRLYDREYPIEQRLGFAFVGMSLLGAIAGFGICIIVGARMIAIVLVALLVLLTAFVSLRVGRRDTEKFLYIITCVLIMVSIPVIYFNAGATHSGVNVWFIFELFYLVLLVPRKYTWPIAGLAIFINLGCYAVHYYAPQFCYELATREDVFISTITSDLVVGYVVCMTVGLFKRVYAAENGALERTQKELEKANSYQKLFLANISHEMRSPLNAVLGLNEMILRSNDMNEIKKYAAQVQESGDALLRQINDILDFNSIESGNMALIPREYDVAQMIRQSFTMQSVKMQEKHLEYRLTVDPNVPGFLIGDEARVKQIITNLLTNSYKYTDRGEVTMSVHATVEDQVATLKLSVKDTGRGISKENQSKLFRVFSRVDIAKNHNIEGTGLGLCITKTLVEMMDGTIEVISDAGKGSEFIVYIKQRCVENAKPIGNFVIETQAVPRKYKELFHAPDARVLVVDDTPLNIRVLARLLKETQVKIDTSTSGQECLEKVKSHEYDLILMDKMMPQMDGITCFKEIRALGVQTTVIMLTADATVETKEECTRIGFADILTKPVNPVDLEETLKKYLPEEKIQ